MEMEEVEEMMGRCKKEYEQLEKMSDNDRADVIRGYHNMITDKLSSVLETLQDVQRLSPLTIPLTRTAVIIAEVDFIKQDGLRVAGVVGHQDSMKKVVEGLWEQIPQIFEAVCKAKGYIRGN